MAGLQPYHHGTLSEKEKDFERQRFEHYVAMRATHLDRRALEAWELYHNDRDGRADERPSDGREVADIKKIHTRHSRRPREIEDHRPGSNAAVTIVDDLADATDG